MNRESDKRQRLLAAATECFRLYGFHNATIALIAQHSEMSVGQIYHYFANKEAIIAACVEQQLEAVYALYDELERADNVTGAMLDGPPRAARVDSQLMMEVHAEAARNPFIANLMSDVDERLRSRIKQLIRRSDTERGRADSPDLEMRAEALLALQIGMHVRLSLNRSLNPERFKELFRLPLRAILEGKYS